MTFRAILTNRELKNKITGIDLYVSDYQEIPHKIRNTYLYHVIAVTNLFYYKSKEHKQSDVVQFMVSKTFEEFEELYHKLYKRFPSVNFPPLPSRSLLSNKTDERRDCMDKVMKLVANTQKLSSSTMLIEFLKGKKESVSDHPLVVQEENTEEESVSEQNDEPPANNDLFDTTEEGEEENLFDAPSSKTQQNGHKLTDTTDGVKNLVISGDSNNRSSLFDDDEGKLGAGDDDLFQPPPTDARKSAFDKNYTINFNDSDDLLDVNDDVDDLLKLSESSEKHSEIKVQKPSVPARMRTSFTDEQLEDDTNAGEQIFTRTKSQSLKKVRSDSGNLDDIFSKNKKGGLFDEDDDDDLFSTAKTPPTAKGDISGMGHEDILNYIKANDS